MPQSLTQQSTNYSACLNNNANLLNLLTQKPLQSQFYKTFKNKYKIKLYF